jgi:hypothetical protein
LATSYFILRIIIIRIGKMMISMTTRSYRGKDGRNGIRAMEKKTGMAPELFGHSPMMQSP